MEASIEIVCLFTRDKTTEYSTQVLAIDSVESSNTEIECKLPKISDGHPSNSLTLSVIVTQTNEIIEQSYFLTSANSLSLELVPIPFISHVEPQNVFNMHNFKNITIYGANFAKTS